MKKTLVLGASKRQNSYAYLALLQLAKNNIDTIGIGLEKGEIANISILTGTPQLSDIHTITLYLNPKRQVALLDYMISLKPKRVIFNPGTENPEAYEKLRKAGIEVEIACTLVLLATGQY
ncbi:CoA-binding protein [Namhaeicola litoreus]|uniref:CoA-binding protein n=1 Tax=Namhaeicola litoreus TaxID=1052145 RepID=A0ABW3Y4Q0_9FLAO